MQRASSIFEVVTQEASIGIAVFDPGSQLCVTLNRSAREMLAVGFGDDNQVPLLKLSDLMPENPGAGSYAGPWKPLRDEMVRENSYFPEVLMRKRDGLSFVASITVRTVTVGPGENRILLMFQDITQQKKMQRDLETKQEELRGSYEQVLEKNKQLMELDSAKDRFIALTTHELRTPLSAIVATAEVLKLRLYESEEQRDQFIETLHEQGMHLMELVNDILDFAKIRAGKMDLFLEEIDVVGSVRKIAAEFEQMASQSRIGIEFDDPVTEIFAYADVLRLKEIISNVINNAIKFNHPGGFVRIGFQILEEKKRVRVVISDTGIGIAADLLPHVFNEFETVDHVAKHHKGTGLGMPISKRLAEAMGGGISLQSTEGEGTMFFIDIPTDRALPEELYRSRSDFYRGGNAA